MSAEPPTTPQLGNGWSQPDPIMNFSRVYRRLAELPLLTSVSFVSREQISVESTVRDHVNNVKRPFIQEIGIPDKVSTVYKPGHQPPFWLSTPVERAEAIVGRLISPSGKRTALLRETTSTPKKRFVEIWRGDCAELILETTTRHGAFYADATFSSLCFSPQEDALLYTAESNAPEEDAEDPFHKFRFDAQYGEQFVERRRPTLFWLRWDPLPAGLDSGRPEPARRLVQIIPSIECVPTSLSSSRHLEDPPAFSLGQAVFASTSGRNVLATAYLRTKGDRKLGIVYCTNRPSMIVHFTLPDIALDEEESATGQRTEGETEKEKKSKDKFSIKCHDLFSEYPARSPRVWFPTAEDHYFPLSPKDPVAIWLSSAKEPHGSCSRLHMVTLSANGPVGGGDRVKKVVDSVWEPSIPAQHGGFPGLFVNQLPASPFLSLNGRLYAICVSNWGSNQEILAIRLEGDDAEASPELAVPPPNIFNHSQQHGIFRFLPAGRTSTSFVACDGKARIVAVASSLTEPNELLIADLAGRNTIWKRITDVGGRVKDLVFDLEGDAIDIHGHEPAQALYLKVTHAENQPLITFPHGGPHSVSHAAFSPEIVAFALSGYTICLPNYRGSLGYGQRWVEELLGKIGTLDVEDVMAVAKQMIKNDLAVEGPGMQFYTGGSHGGFLGAHVIGQYPSFFSAAVLRNPVINIPSMHATTDIPDWTTVECGIPYNPGSALTPQQYEIMYRMSPIQYVDAVVTPVLLRIGDIDQRVPPSQGREYYHLLKAKGMGERVQMMWYPENGHPLDKVEAERAGWDATLAWFKKYGK